mmetsp:Transcript_12343/g.40232  ORF Transcript_12343/g.40232 Transcript_12343/m.40232 type:complete len:510 (+) Transcript_12343:31-1560(+)
MSTTAALSLLRQTDLLRTSTTLCEKRRASCGRRWCVGVLHDGHVDARDRDDLTLFASELGEGDNEVPDVGPAVSGVNHPVPLGVLLDHAGGAAHGAQLSIPTAQQSDVDPGEWRIHGCGVLPLLLRALLAVRLAGRRAALRLRAPALLLDLLQPPHRLLVADRCRVRRRLHHLAAAPRPHAHLLGDGFGPRLLLLLGQLLVQRRRPVVAPRQRLGVGLQLLALRVVEVAVLGGEGLEVLDNGVLREDAALRELDRGVDPGPVAGGHAFERPTRVLHLRVGALGVVGEGGELAALLGGEGEVERRQVGEAEDHARLLARERDRLRKEAWPPLLRLHAGHEDVGADAAALDDFVDDDVLQDVDLPCAPVGHLLRVELLGVVEVLVEREVDLADLEGMWAVVDVGDVVEVLVEGEVDAVVGGVDGALEHTCRLVGRVPLVRDVAAVLGRVGRGVMKEVEAGALPAAHALGQRLRDWREVGRHAAGQLRKERREREDAGPRALEVVGAREGHA